MGYYRKLRNIMTLYLKMSSVWWHFYQFDIKSVTEVSSNPLFFKTRIKTKLRLPEVPIHEVKLAEFQWIWCDGLRKNTMKLKQTLVQITELIFN